MSAKRSTQTQQARRAVQSRPSASTLQKENQILRKQVLMLRAELDESGEVERFLRTRLRDLNANIRVDRAHLAELEGGRVRGHRTSRASQRGVIAARAMTLKRP